MTQRVRKRKCKYCYDFFRPDHRSAGRQKFCSKPQCRKASKAASRQRWLGKPENKNYFKGPYQVQRVQLWRKNHPGYWRKRQNKENTLQDSLKSYPKQCQEVTQDLHENALQDVLKSQPAVFIGFIAQLIGSTLQDDIDLTARRMRQLGADILNCKPSNIGGYDDSKTPNMSKPNQKDPRTIQLDRSPSGA